MNLLKTAFGWRLCFCENGKNRVMISCYLLLCSYVLKKCICFGIIYLRTRKRQGKNRRRCGVDPSSLYVYRIGGRALPHGPVFCLFRPCNWLTVAGTAPARHFVISFYCFCSIRMQTSGCNGLILNLKLRKGCLDHSVKTYHYYDNNAFGSH